MRQLAHEVRQIVRIALQGMYPGCRVIPLHRPNPPRAEKVQLFCTCDLDAVLPADRLSRQEVMLKLRWLETEHNGRKLRAPFWAEQCSRCGVVYFYVFAGAPGRAAAPA